jgi:hypothetical protein
MSENSRLSAREPSDVTVEGSGLLRIQIRFKRCFSYEHLNEQYTKVLDIRFLCLFLGLKDLRCTVPDELWMNMRWDHKLGNAKLRNTMSYAEISANKSRLIKERYILLSLLVYLDWFLF